MTKAEVIKLLRENKNERGIANWKKQGEKGTSLKSLGIGLTKLRKIAKKVGRNHRLARSLWNSDYDDAKVVGLLIDEPKKLTREQVEGLEGGYLSHVFSSCDATLPKAPFAFEVSCEWLESNDSMRRRCAYGLLYEFSKMKKSTG